MDPLSVTASLVSIIQITDIVLLSCYRLHGQIKDAEREICQVITEVEDLAVILNDLRDAIRLSRGDASLLAPRSTNILNDKCSGPLASIKTVLDDLSQKLAPLSRPGLKTRLRWPFEAKSVQRMLEVIQNQKSTLQLSLSTHQTKMLVQQSDKIANLHDSITEMGEHLHIAMTTMSMQAIDSIQHLADQTKRDTILKWYKSCDPEQNHRLAREKYDPSTAKWIFNIKEFQSWTMNEGKTLWLHGIPGAGKTILCSTIIDHMQEICREDPRFRVIYYYFDFSDSGKQSVASFLKSIVFQLISAADTIPESAVELYESCSGLQEPSLEELFGLFVNEIEKPGRTFLLIDALDECVEGQRRLFFKNFAKCPLPTSLSFLVTSRKEPDIEAALGEFISYQVPIQSSVVDKDVRNYVSGVISQDVIFQKWQPAIRQEMLDAIVDGSHGMFRWAVCQLDTMRKCVTPAMVRAELKRMPEDLNQMYDRIFQAVPTLHQQYVQSAMQWLAFSTRPLLLHELAEAVVIDPANEEFDAHEARLMDESFILRLCGTLVRISIKDFSPYSKDWLGEKIGMEHTHYPPQSSSTMEFHVVSLSHYSVREYITSKRLQESSISYFFTSERIANQFLAECCLLYLIRLNGGEIVIPPNFQEHPLLQYSARYWVDHWTLSDKSAQDTRVRRLLSRLFNPSNLNAYVNWLNVWKLDANVLGNNPFQFSLYHREIRRSAELHPQPLYFAAFLGDLPLVQSLVIQGADIFAKEGYFGSAFAAATFQGHLPVVNFFLQQGADPNLQGVKFGSIIQTAAAGGSPAVVSLLLDAGANVNAQGGLFNTALIAAASQEHDAVVTILVQHGADLNIGSRYHGSSLYQAAASGDTKTVIILLGAGADINSIGDSDGTALYAAALSGSVHLVQLLLRKGADVNKGGCGEFGYPIVAAAAKGHVQVVRILLRAGADPNLSKSNSSVSALAAAIESRDLPTFRTVLGSGANLNNSGSRYMNCFHSAIWTGELAMAKILLQNGAEFEDKAFLEGVLRYKQDPYFMSKMLDIGANVDAHAGAAGSALHIAISTRCEEAVWLLLGRDPYLDAVADTGSVLSTAISAGMTKVAEELIRRGADIKGRAKGHSPFSVACGQGNFDLATLILERGADINSGGGEAVFWACFNKHEKMLRFLVEHGADLNLVTDSQECTPLQYALEQANMPIIKLLLELGAKINGKPGQRGSTIHYSLLSQNESIVSYILENGADVVDCTPGESVLFKALAFGMKDSILPLLEKGGNINQKERGITALGHCFNTDDRDAAKLLLEHGATYAEAGPSVLIQAIKKRSGAEVRKLLDYGMDPNCDDNYQTPLGAATQSGRKEVIALLLEYGGNLNAKTEINGGALSIACRDGDFAMAEFLLIHGADPNLVKEGYRYPLYDAAMSGNIQLIDLLLQHGANIRINGGDVFKAACIGGEKVITGLLHLSMSASEREIFLDRSLQGAAYNANLNLCTWLLEQGANLNYFGGEYGSPLQAAVSNDQLYDPSQVNNQRLMVEMLLERGARVNRSNSDENSPSALQIALSSRQSKLARVLLGAGADVNEGGGRLHSPLQAAARYTPSLLEPLLARGAKINAVGGTYGSALHAAAYTHNTDSIKILLSHGADVNLIAGKYGSLIQAAAKENAVSSGTFTAQRESVQAMELLYKHGASITAQSGKYHTALQIAAKSGNLEAVKWLVKNGADPHVKGGKYGTALHAAVRKEKYAIVSFLEQYFSRNKSIDKHLVIGVSAMVQC